VVGSELLEVAELSIVSYSRDFNRVIARSTGFEVHRTSSPSSAFSANLCIDGNPCRKYAAAFSELNWLKF